MKIAPKILSGYLAISILLIAMAVLVVQTSSVLNPVVDELDNEVNNLNVALTSQIVLLRSQLGHEATQFYFTKDPAHEQTHERTANQLDRVFDQISLESINEDEGTIFRNLQRSTDRLEQFEKQFMVLVSSNQPGAYEFLSENSEYQRLDKSISTFINSYSFSRKVESTDEFSRLVAISDSIQDSRADLNRRSSITLVLVSVASIVSILLGVVVSRSISSPIRALERTTKVLAGGDMSARSSVETRDEIGVLAASFNSMVSKLEESTVSKDYLGNILQSMQDSLLVLSSGGYIQTVNRSVLDLLGYDEEELIGKSIVEVVEVVEVVEAVKEQSIFRGTPLQELIKVGGVQGIATRYKTKRGALLPMLFSGAVMHDEDGEILGIVCVATDLTARKRAETVLHETQTKLIFSAKLASLGEMSAGLAHELNQPLGVIQLRGDMIQKLLIHNQSANSVKIASHLVEIFGEIERASKIISHLKLFIRQELPGSHSAIDMNWLIDESLVLLSSTLQLQGIELTTELAKELPEVWCDYIQIEQVLTNLLTNARDAVHHSDEKKIRVRSYRQNESVCVDVVDTGCGIAKAHIDKIFDPFFTTKPVGAGTGLGMSISYGIVRDHNGALSVNSTEGQGSIFTLSLPLSHQQQTDGMAQSRLDQKA